MDPNTNQPEGVNPIPQPTAQPAVPPAESAPVTPTPAAPASIPDAPKGKSKKAIILIVILLLLVIGIAVYIMFAKSQLNNNQTTTDNNSSVLPTPTAIPTLTPEEDLEAASPQADLLDIDADVKGL